MKVWITERALSAIGIREAEVEKINGHVNLVQEQLPKRMVVYRKPHWHWNKADALEQARKMREARLASLRKSIPKLEKLDWK